MSSRGRCLSGLAASCLLLILFHQASCLSMSATSPSASASLTKLSLGGPELREAVLQASASNACSDSSLDVNGIIWMEHVNMVVGSRPVAEKFYMDFLGFTKDKSKSFHVNLGQQQFHLAEGDPPQRVTGSIGLTVPSLSTIRQRTREAADLFEGTQFAVLNDSDDCITLSCPWGNTINLYGVVDDDTDSSTINSRQKMTNMHADGAVYGPRMAVRGQPGIRYIEIACRPGTSSRIANFYSDIMGCDTVEIKPTCTAVSIGPGVHLVYAENDQLSEEDSKSMEGVHVCFYANDFKGLYNRLKAKDLVWTNPRFTHLDSCDTWEEAHASRTLRFKDVIDLETGEKLVELEHETRPLRHGQFLKVPYYEPR